MSIATVFRDDLRNTRRSYLVIGIIGVLALLVALIVYSDAEFYPNAYRALFDVSFLLFLAFPVALAPLTYLAVAGDRERGSIQHTLGLPNTRLAYLLGTTFSRMSVAVGAVIISMLVAAVIGTIMYTEPIAIDRFVLFTAISTLFVASMTTIFVAISALSPNRSRAMVGVIGAYFILGPFWFGFLPVVSLQVVLDTIASALGVTLSDSTSQAIQFSSPITAYLTGLKPVYHGVIDTGVYPRIDQNYVANPDVFYAQPWYTYLTMVAWATVAFAVSYIRFRRAELG